MLELDEHQSLYVNLLVEALKRFYKTDANDLFDDKTGTDERSMVACVFHYMKYLHENQDFSELEPHIDLEYDRMIDSEKGRVQKALDPISCPHANCRNYDSCGAIIKAKLKSIKCEDCKGKLFRPDLIVHERNSEPGTGNGLVVEFKKSDSEKGDMVYDIAKVMACTCGKGRFKYKVGAFVILYKVFAQVYVFSGGQYRGKFSVDKDGRKESSPDCSQVCQEA